MKLSVITPTKDRHLFLKCQYELLKNQTHTDWEWLIHDSSFKPFTFAEEDKRIRYFYDNQKVLSIGEKRNLLVEQAKGNGIVHFDDDDYYAPNYLQTVAETLKSYDFFNIHSWFAYHLDARQFYYWDTDEEGMTHFVIDELTGVRVREIDFGTTLTPQATKIKEIGHRGYGFSYAYLKKLWLQNPFRDRNISEDRFFYDAAEKEGAKVFSFADRKGLVVHMLHQSNISRIFPQYRIPSFLLEEKMAPFLTYVASLCYES